QRAGRQYATVAYAASILNDNLDISAQREVLKAVIGNDHIDFRKRPLQGAQRQRTVGMYRNRRSREHGDQRRLITKPARIGVSACGKRVISQLRAITTADDARGPPMGAQGLRERDDNGRFSGAANV